MLSYGFSGSGVQAWLSRVCCSGSHQAVMEVSGGLHSGVQWEEFISMLIQVAGRIHFLGLYKALSL